MFSNSVLGGSAVIPESNEWYAASVNYAIAEEFYALSEQAWRDQDPREACCESLTALAARDGVYPRPATFAQGYVKLTGTAAAVLPVPLTFAISGAVYVTADNAQQPTAIDATGSVVIRVKAQLAGAVGNRVAATGTLSTIVANVSADVIVCGGTFCAGANAEACETFRARYLRRLQYNPRATNAWIIGKLLEWPCATRALQRAGSCCQCNSDCAGTGCTDCGCKDCGGSLAFYLMFDGSFDGGVAPASMIKEAETWLFGSPQGYGLGQVEIGVCGRIVPVQAVKFDVYLDIRACPSTAQLQQIRAAMTEYATTFEPSQPVRAAEFTAIVANILGSAVVSDVRLELTSQVDGYSFEQERLPASKVFVTRCDLQPDCDYVLSLNSISISNPSTSQTDCNA